MNWMIIFIISVILALASPAIAKEIKLMIPEPASEETRDSKTGQVKTYWSFPKAEEEKRTYNEVDLKKFTDQFKDYFQVEHIELWVEGRTESKAITRLFISFGGAGGIKVVLRLNK